MRRAVGAFLVLLAAAYLAYRSGESGRGGPPTAAPRLYSPALSLKPSVPADEKSAPTTVTAIPAAVPVVLPEECLESLRRLRALQERGLRRDAEFDEYTRRVSEELAILEPRVRGHFDAFLAHYRSLPRPGDDGDRRCRAALLYLLPKADRPEFDAEVASRLVGLIRDPKDGDSGDLRFLAYAARHRQDPSSLYGVVEEVSSLSDLRTQFWIWEGVASKPAPGSLKDLLKAWEASSNREGLQRLLAYACLKFPDEECLPALRGMLAQPGADPELLVTALGTVPSPAALEALLDVAGEGNERARAQAWTELGRRLGEIGGRKNLTKARGEIPWGPLGGRVAKEIYEEEYAVTNLKEFRFRHPKAAKEEVERALGRLELLLRSEPSEVVACAGCGVLGSTQRVSVLGSLSLLEQDPRPKVREAAARAREAILKDPQ